jgi:hypothetical protein
MKPGEVMAIYAAQPDMRVVQDYTSDPGRLLASVGSFFASRFPDAAGKKQLGTIGALVPPMLSALRDAAARMPGAPGRRSVVWISQAYGTELGQSAITEATDATIAAFHDANVLLYAIDTRFSPTCEPRPGRLPGTPRDDLAGTVLLLACYQEQDASDQWMSYLAEATGGRLFMGGNATRLESWNANARSGVGMTQSQGNENLVSSAVRFAVDTSRFAYEMGFYVPESELDGKIHSLSVSVPAKPKLELRYRNGYTASAGTIGWSDTKGPDGIDSNLESANSPNQDEVAIDVKVELPKRAQKDLLVSVALAPETVTVTAEGDAVVEATFTQMDYLGKQLSRVQETARVAAPDTEDGMFRYNRALKPTQGAVLLQITIRDAATNRVGSIGIPIGNQ